MRTRIPLLVVSLVALAGCHKQDPLVGSWHGTAAIRGIDQDFALKVAEDGTYTQDMVTSSSATKVRLLVHDKGGWKNLQNGKYEFTLADTDWVTEGATPERAAKARDRFMANKSKIIAYANKNAEETVTWDGNDKFSIQPGQGTESYTRQK